MRKVSFVNTRNYCSKTSLSTSFSYFDGTCSFPFSKSTFFVTIAVVTQGMAN
jgi:hypothetical protein